MARELHSTPQLEALMVAVHRLASEAMAEGQCLTSHYIPLDEFETLCKEYAIPPLHTVAIEGVSILPHEVLSSEEAFAEEIHSRLWGFRW